MIETPQAILSASEIARQSSIQGLILGTNDLSKELRLRPSTTMTTSSSSPTPRMGLMTSLQYTILAARAHNKLAIDGVYNNIASDAANVENFRRECLQGKEIGMDGKTLIHPKQIQAANEIFAPSDKEMKDARRVVACWESAIAEQSSSGRSFTGVAVLDGVMIEQLHVDTARKLLEQAERIQSM
jgi:citrate lyase beta subunit